ncbi:MAG TPA: hypothetical protein VE441_09175 [Mycobacterium sp.]|nr:hypothetical protein [Mycobacterium sp.]
MTSGPSSADRTPLRSLPPPQKSGLGYRWAAAIVGVLLVAAMAYVGFGFFSVPGVDPVRAGGWTFLIWLLITVPSALTVLLLSWLVIAIMRRLGARRWPGVAQAVPAVLVVLLAVFLLTHWLFSGPKT